jgi:hypothetical protein
MRERVDNIIAANLFSERKYGMEPAETDDVFAFIFG